MNVATKIERNTKLNIAQRINAAMAEVDYIQKERKQGMQYTIVSHDAVTAKVRPILQRHGVVYYPRDMGINQSGNRTEAAFNVRFENIDDRTDFIDVATFGYGVDPQDKGPGKAMSYGVKYALLKVLGLETGDDPDTVQDERANHRPVEAPPAREKLEGPYPAMTTLKAAIKAFAESLRIYDDDMAGFTAWMETPEVVELEKAALRYIPQWWDSGEGMPAEYEPITSRITRKKHELEELDSMRQSPAARNIMAG